MLSFLYIFFQKIFLTLPQSLLLAFALLISTFLFKLFFPTQKLFICEGGCILWLNTFETLLIIYVFLILPTHIHTHPHTFLNAHMHFYQFQGTFFNFPSIFLIFFFIISFISLSTAPVTHSTACQLINKRTHEHERKRNSHPQRTHFHS